MNKKEFIEPEVKVFIFEDISILVGSVEEPEAVYCDEFD